MKQIVMQGPKNSKIIEVEMPQINDNQLLVKVIYTGMCHSELYPWATAENGLVLGHETVGTVVKVGGKVKGFSVGDRVTGLGGGGYKEYIVMEPKKTFKVPDNLASEDAIGEPLACIMSVAERIDTGKIGDRIAIVGCGYMGLGLISLLRARGYADIVAVDKREVALENAKKFGATEVYTPDTLPENYILNWNTWGKPDLTRDGHKADIFNIGFKTVVEFAGTEDALELAMEMVSAHGTLGIAGYHNDDMRTLDFKLANIKAIKMFNCHERRIEYEATLVERALRLLSSRQWKFTGVTNHIYSAEEFDKANCDMECHNDNFIKGAVEFI